MGQINWTDATTRHFLAILTDEKDKGNSKWDWNGITKNLNARANISGTVTQCKNHLSALKAKYKTYEALKQLTGIAYNPVTGEVDVEERSTERWNSFLEKYKKHGATIAMSGLANLDLLTKLLAGTTAHGIGGCFSPAMGRGPLYLSKKTTIEEEITGSEVEEEGSGDSEQDRALNLDLNLSGAESESPSKTSTRIVSARKSRKHKSEPPTELSEQKRRETSFDSVIQLLSTSEFGMSSSKNPQKLVSEALTKMKVSQKRGDEYFVQACEYLKNVEDANRFLAFDNDNQRWIYLKGLDEKILFE